MLQCHSNDAKKISGRRTVTKPNGIRFKVSGNTVLYFNETDVFEQCNFGIFSILRHLASLELPNDFDLFPSDVYGWLLPCEHTRDIKSTLHDAVVQGAVDW